MNLPELSRSSFVQKDAGLSKESSRLPGHCWALLRRVLAPARTALRDTLQRSPTSLCREKPQEAKMKSCHSEPRQSACPASAGSPQTGAECSTQPSTSLSPLRIRCRREARRSHPKPPSVTSSLPCPPAPGSAEPDQPPWKQPPVLRAETRQKGPAAALSLPLKAGKSKALPFAFRKNRWLQTHGHIRGWTTDGHTRLLVSKITAASLLLGTYAARLYQESTHGYRTHNTAASALLFQGRDPGLLQSSVIVFGNWSPREHSGRRVPREGREQPEASCLSSPCCQEEGSGKTAAWNSGGRDAITSREGPPRNGPSSRSVSGPLTNSIPTAKPRVALREGKRTAASPSAHPAALHHANRERQPHSLSGGYSGSPFL